MVPINEYTHHKQILFCNVFHTFSQRFHEQQQKISYCKGSWTFFDGVKCFLSFLLVLDLLYSFKQFLVLNTYQQLADSRAKSCTFPQSDHYYHYSITLGLTNCWRLYIQIYIQHKISYTYVWSNCVYCVKYIYYKNKCQQIK